MNMNKIGLVQVFFLLFFSKKLEPSLLKDNIMTKMKQYRDWMEKEKTQGEFEMHYEYIMKYFYETDQGNAELRVRILESNF